MIKNHENIFALRSSLAKEAAVPPAILGANILETFLASFEITAQEQSDVLLALKQIRTRANELSLCTCKLQAKAVNILN